MKAQVWRNANLARDWLELPELDRLVGRIAANYHVAPADVPDLIQETRIALWGLGLETRVSNAWVIRTAAHKGVDHMRVTLRARRREQTYAKLALDEPCRPDLEGLLRSHVTNLPSHLKRFYELYYVLGMTEREVARELDICRASVRWLDRCVRRIILGQS